MMRGAYHVPILTYHRVGEFCGDHVPTVSPSAFEQQLTFLARARYRVVELSEVARCVQENLPIRPRRVVMTFDDGYEETYRLVWPLLKRFGFSATVFVAPGDIGRAGFLTWEQLTQMSRDGLTIGSHTMDQTYLPVADEERVMHELLESKRVLEERLGRPIQYLSYPSGGFTPQAMIAAQRAGYTAACTTNRCISRWPVDPFALRRIKVTERDRHPLRFWAKISGYYDLFRRLNDPS